MTESGLFFPIPIENIRTSRQILRNPLISIEDLLISIKQNGLINPPMVRLIHDDYEIIAGHRRLEACRLLGWKKVTCQIVDVDDKTAYEISVIENVQQETLSPIEEAHAFRDYVEMFGWGSESDLAGRIGKSQEYISKRIRLLSLPASLQKDILEGRINVSTAEELFPLQDGEIAQQLGKYVEKNAWNKQETRQVVNVLRKDLNIHDRLQIRDRITSTIKDLEQANAQDSTLSKVYDTLNATFKRSILGIRISLKNIDEVVEDLDGIQYDNLEFGWFIKEMIMEHRFRLHQQLDLLLKQRSKLERLYNKRRHVALSKF